MENRSVPTSCRPTTTTHVVNHSGPLLLCTTVENESARARKNCKAVWRPVHAKIILRFQNKYKCNFSYELLMHLVRCRTINNYRLEILHHCLQCVTCFRKVGRCNLIACEEIAERPVHAIVWLRLISSDYMSTKADI